MEHYLKRCVTCGSHKLKDGIVYHGKVEIPAQICADCGESYTALANMLAAEARAKGQGA